MDNGKNLSDFRKVWLKFHLFLAFSCGGLFALIGLTGSLSVYREEIDRLLNPSLVVEQSTVSYQSLDRILASVRKAHPDRHGAWTLEMPRAADGTVTAWFEKPRETVGEGYAPLMVSVNPYTAEVVASRFWGRTFTTVIIDLHTSLNLGRWGGQAVGMLGLLLTVSIASGLYLWWPGVRRLLQSLAIRREAGMIAQAFDLHRNIGLISAMPLLILAMTGCHLSYPELLENLLGASDMGHGNNGPTIRSTAIANDRPVTLTEAVLVARGPFPDADVKRITTPAGEEGIYRVNLRQKNELDQKHPPTLVWVDRWSGQIKAARNPKKMSGGENLLMSSWPIHTGEWLGSKGRLLWFASGLSLVFLFISGLMHWLCRHGLIKDKSFDPYRFNGIAEKGLRRARGLTIDGLGWLLLVVKAASRQIPGIMRRAGDHGKMTGNWLLKLLQQLKAKD